MEDVVDEMRFHLKKEQEIVLTTSGEPIFVTDKRMLKNILLNLLSNAIKFSPEGKTIYMRAENADGKLSITVKDEGLGIPEEDQPHLFSTFFRAKNVSNIQGTGLGLPIAKRYANLLGGSMDFKSRIEEGTVFFVFLPKLQTNSVGQL